MLSARIDDLTQRVQDFAAQHEKHAAALQAQRRPGLPRPPGGAPSTTDRRTP